MSELKLKYLFLAHRKYPDLAHLWVATGKKKLTQLLSMVGTRKYLQQFTAFFTLPPHFPTLFYKKKLTSKPGKMVLWDAVHHLLSLLPFQIKLLFLALITHLSIYWPVVQRAIQTWTQEHHDTTLGLVNSNLDLVSYKPWISFLSYKPSNNRCLHFGSTYSYIATFSVTAVPRDQECRQTGFEIRLPNCCII